MKSTTNGIILLYCLTKFACFQISSCNSENVSNRDVRRVDADEVTCLLPPHPKNGRWSLLNGSGRPGDEIYKNSVVKIECDPDFKLSSHTSFLICDEHWSLSKIPICEKKCPAKFSTSTTIIKCEDKYGAEVPCDEAVDGTYLSYSCIPFYETPFGYKKTILCLEGIWNFPNPVCQPVCGKKIDKDAIQLVFNGLKLDHREYPWVAALFKKDGNGFQNICGGSLVSQRVVITAAHCVSNDYGDALSADLFTIATGKYYSKYNDSRDVKVQYSEIARVVVHPGYKGPSRRYLADLALLITKDLINFNEITQPICYQDLPSIYLQASKTGIVAGWGKTETEEQPDELRILEIPYKHEITCSQELPPDWDDKYNTIDKICAGFFNQSKGVCSGDSGSGLYFKNPEDNRFYIHGVVSLAPRAAGECDVQQNALYTKVANYYDFVDREVTRQFVEQCSLPTFPKNGKWIIADQDKKPGDIVPSNTILKVQCNQGYALSSTTPFIDCESSYAIPKCELLCPKLNFPEGTTYQCITKSGDDTDCSKAVQGTSLSYSCPEGYKLPSGGNRVKFCKGGSWGQPKPECVEDDSVKKPVIENQVKVICTYASWSAYDGVLPEQFNASLCTHIVYAFIGLWDKGDVRVQDDSLDLDGASKGLYRKVTDLKKVNKDLKVLLSTGGSGAANASLFSGMAASEAKRAGFIYSAIYFIEKYDFDGVDIEWHYPESNDKANYVKLLKDFRKKCDEKNLLMTATVRSYPEETGYDGTEMAALLDWVHIKTYDFYGPWSAYTGHNSPLYPGSVENSWEKSHLNIEAAARNWMNFGIPKSKMVLSIAFYGRTFTLKDKSKNGVHAAITGAGPGDSSGFLRYSEICKFKTTGWTEVWDDEQKSVYSFKDDKWVGHETKDSVWIKGAYVKDNGFLGVNVWPLDGDDVLGRCGSKQILLKHVHGGLGNHPNFDN